MTGVCILTYINRIQRVPIHYRTQTERMTRHRHPRAQKLCSGCPPLASSEACAAAASKDEDPGSVLANPGLKVCSAGVLTISVSIVGWRRRCAGAGMSTCRAIHCTPLARRQRPSASASSRLRARSGSPSALGPTLKLVMPCSRHRGSYAQIVPFDE